MLHRRKNHTVSVPPKHLVFFFSSHFSKGQSDSFATTTLQAALQTGRFCACNFRWFHALGCSLPWPSMYPRFQNHKEVVKNCPLQAVSQLPLCLPWIPCVRESCRYRVYCTFGPLFSPQKSNNQSSSKWIILLPCCNMLHVFLFDAFNPSFHDRHWNVISIQFSLIIFWSNNYYILQIFQKCNDVWWHLMTKTWSKFAHRFWNSAIIQTQTFQQCVLANSLKARFPMVHFGGSFSLPGPGVWWCLVEWILSSLGRCNQEL